MEMYFEMLPNNFKGTVSEKKKKREGELVSKLGYSFPQNERKNGDQDCSCGKEVCLMCKST